jgi:Flp pilus assembly protein TadD
LGDEASALNYYQHASELDANYARPWERIGTMRYTRGDYEDAALAFERALMLGADDLNIRLNLGLAYANNGDCVEAIENLAAARQMAGADERTNAIIQSGYDMCAVVFPPQEPGDETGDEESVLP